jgi:hypothetical protein
MPARETRARATMIVGRDLFITGLLQTMPMDSVGLRLVCHSPITWILAWCVGIICSALFANVLVA